MSAVNSTVFKTKLPFKWAANTAAQVYTVNHIDTFRSIKLTSVFTVPLKRRKGL